VCLLPYSPPVISTSEQNPEADVANEHDGLIMQSEREKMVYVAGRSRLWVSVWICGRHASR